jgi:hypothetical protein
MTNSWLGVKKKNRVGLLIENTHIFWPNLQNLAQSKKYLQSEINGVHYTVI